MAFKHGRNYAVLVDNYDLSAYFNDASISHTTETSETTTFGAASFKKTYIRALSDSVVSLSGLYDPTATSGPDVVLNTMVTSDSAASLTIVPEGLTDGNRCMLGKGLLTSYEVTGSVGDAVSDSADFQADAGVFHGWLHESGAQSANSSTVSGTAIDLSSAFATTTTNGYAATLHVTSNIHTNSASAKIQHSSDNSVWADLLLFANVAKSATSGQFTAGTGTINQFTRSVITFQGTASAVINIGFARK